MTRSNRKTLQRNEFAYELPEGTRHFVMWYTYGPCPELSDSQISLGTLAIQSKDTTHSHRHSRGLTAKAWPRPLSVRMVSEPKNDHSRRVSCASVLVLAFLIAYVRVNIVSMSLRTLHVSQATATEFHMVWLWCQRAQRYVDHSPKRATFRMSHDEE